MKFSIQPFIDVVEREKLNIEGIIVWQDGQFLAHHQFVEEVRREQFSVTKSFVSAAVGFALQEGLVSLDDRVVDCFPDKLPEHISDNLAECRLRHLLSMTPGQKRDELSHKLKYEPGFKVDDYIKAALALPFDVKPGTYFWYNNPALHMAGRIVQQKAGCDLVDFLMPRLFTPLGMARPNWVRDSEGYCHGAMGIQIRLSELFRFIEMYYNFGKVNGKQILDRDWIELSTSRIVDNSHFEDLADNHCGYGYAFWRGQHNSFRADGYHAKFGVVLRDINAIVCINSDERRQQGVLDAMWESVYPQLAENAK